MRVTNTSAYPLEECKRLLVFAARGVRDSAIEVHVKGGRWCRGTFYEDIPREANVARTSNALITISIPADGVPKRTWCQKCLKRIAKLWPEGIPLENWQDWLVYIGAHEFRHVWQAQRRERTGRAGKCEYDASKFGLKRLNAWREATGREPVPAVKQPNPFAK